MQRGCDWTLLRLLLLQSRRCLWLAVTRWWHAGRCRVHMRLRRELPGDQLVLARLLMLQPHVCQR